MKSFTLNESGNWRAFRHKNFRILFRANIIANIGSWIQRIAQAWLVLQLTQSGTYLGIITAVQMASFLLVILQGGAMADRFDKRKVLLITNLSFLITSLTLGLLVVTDNVRLWHVMTLAFVLGLTDGIDKPVRQSFVSELVGKTDIPNAIGLNSANFNFGRLAGPAVAGLLISIFGTGPTFLISSCTYSFVIIANLRIKWDQLFEIPKALGPVSIKEGLQYVAARPDIFVTMLLCFFMATFSLNFEIFNALITTQVFEKGVTSFGLLGTFVAIGSFAAALFSSRLEKYRSTRFVFIGSIVLSIIIFLTSLMPTYLTYSILLTFAGAAALTTIIAANSITQLNSDHIIRGRVLSIYQFAFLAGIPISSPIIGWSSEHFGIRPTISGCAVFTLIPILVIWVIYRDRIEVPDEISVSAVLAIPEL